MLSIYYKENLKKIIIFLVLYTFKKPVIIETPLAIKPSIISELKYLYFKNIKN